MEGFLSTAEAAQILGISRIAVFHKIQSGEIKAKKIGRNYVIRREDLGDFFQKELSKHQKELISNAVHKAVKEYGETLQLLKDE